MHVCVCAQAVATDARLAAVLQALWPWLLGDDAVMEAALELLCVYTASCPAGNLGGWVFVEDRAREVDRDGEIIGLCVCV